MIERWGQPQVYAERSDTGTTGDTSESDEVIAALDDGYEAGSIDESSYREIRDSKKAELVEVTRRLRL